MLNRPSRKQQATQIFILSSTNSKSGMGYRF